MAWPGYNITRQKLGAVLTAPPDSKTSRLLQYHNLSVNEELRKASRPLIVVSYSDIFKASSHEVQAPYFCGCCRAVLETVHCSTYRGAPEHVLPFELTILGAGFTTGAFLVGLILEQSYPEKQSKRSSIQPGTKFNESKLTAAFWRVAGLKSIRDDRIACDESLKDAGIPMRIDVYLGSARSIWPFSPYLSMSKATVDIGLDAEREGGLGGGSEEDVDSHHADSDGGDVADHQDAGHANSEACAATCDFDGISLGAIKPPLGPHWLMPNSPRAMSFSNFSKLGSRTWANQLRRETRRVPCTYPPYCMIRWTDLQAPVHLHSQQPTVL
ncbi:uncharacterized protein BDR25DRAFT_354288 [Lindgomyces ingoldianus]|uniref:Uncharacterized protein n=1 Tax=Lindgomyces ingoldianus TaxID=673940 RepID=A0ACB6QZ26_9PLEO|nr:uncharacterized protein BDR25DRAFT_354288 [Lindgomyces ingoldianus]KAF2471790.1 hypothetical protein BDR25DRAFT_354288 [Lindgomyces ingoldianus]